MDLLYVIPVALLILGVLAGNFLALWVLTSISTVFILCICFIVWDMKRPNSMPGTSGKLGGDILGAGILVCMGFFMLAMWVTYLITSDYSGPSTLINILSNIDFVRSK